MYLATIPEHLWPFLRKYMNAPELVQIDAHKKTTDNTKHYLIHTKHHDRYTVLKNIMDIIDPYICLIFVRETGAISHPDQLRSDGYRVGEIHGDLEPRERKQMMRRINNNEYQYIVATDIATKRY